jgi:hypothetical protein
MKKNRGGGVGGVVFQKKLPVYYSGHFIFFQIALFVEDRFCLITRPEKILPKLLQRGDPLLLPHPYVPTFGKCPYRWDGPYTFMNVRPLTLS